MFYVVLGTVYTTCEHLEGTLVILGRSHTVIPMYQNIILYRAFIGFIFR